MATTTTTTNRGTNRLTEPTEAQMAIIPTLGLHLFGLRKLNAASVPFSLIPQTDTTKFLVWGHSVERHGSSFEGNAINERSLLEFGEAVNAVFDPTSRLGAYFAQMFAESKPEGFIQNAAVVAAMGEEAWR